MNNDLRTIRALISGKDLAAAASVRNDKPIKTFERYGWTYNVYRYHVTARDTENGLWVTSMSSSPEKAVVSADVSVKALLEERGVNPDFLLEGPVPELSISVLKTEEYRDLVRRGICPYCGRDVDYDTGYDIYRDAYFCPRCDEWLEAPCGSDSCSFCADRAAFPSLDRRYHKGNRAYA